MNKQGIISLRLKTVQYNLEEIFTQIETLIGKCQVNLDEKPVEYIVTLLKNTLSFIESKQSESEKITQLETKVQNLLKVIRKEELPSGTTFPQVLEDADSSNTSGGNGMTQSLSSENFCNFKVEIPEEKIILCMKDFNKTRGTIHTLDPRACQQCYEKGLVLAPSAPHRKTFDELLEEANKREEEKRRQYNEATKGASSSSFHETYVKARDPEKFRDPLSGNFPSK